jgi:hypothetical protein
LLILFLSALAAMMVLLVIFTIRLLALFPCVVLFVDQLLPFLLALLIASVFPAILLNMFWYVLFRTCGAMSDIPLAHFGTTGDVVDALPTAEGEVAIALTPQPDSTLFVV